MADNKISLADRQKAALDAFKVTGEEGTGSISESELRQLLLNLGDALSPAEVEELMKEVTVNADGTVSYESFVDMLVTGYPLASA
ncbi:EF-hand domain-containing protein [Streptomyces sp. NPDC052069]|uniref:EF-hand domain-containing protein n=1 Tax=Streptomyces sp. NPDC052069 TaxID=3154650 RepID=UPI003414B317